IRPSDGFGDGMLEGELERLIERAAVEHVAAERTDKVVLSLRESGPLLLRCDEVLAVDVEQLFSKLLLRHPPLPSIGVQQQDRLAFVQVRILHYCLSYRGRQRRTSLRKGMWYYLRERNRVGPDPGQSHYPAKKFFAEGLSGTTEHAKDFSRSRPLQ